MNEKETYNHLREIRKKAGVTQLQLAEELGVSEKTVSNWESGKNEMTGYSLMMLCDYFMVSPDEIYGTGHRSEDWELKERIVGVYASLPMFGKRLLCAIAETLLDAIEEEAEDSLDQQRFEDSL